MTNRELLELAAKAWKINGRFMENHPEDGAPAYSFGIGRQSIYTKLWNPLTNDGDALRLAVFLSMRIATSKNGCAVRYGDDYENLIAVGLDEAEDCYLATRIAITRASAEIGKSMNA